MKDILQIKEGIGMISVLEICHYFVDVVKKYLTMTIQQNFKNIDQKVMSYIP